MVILSASLYPALASLINIVVHYSKELLTDMPDFQGHS